MIEKLYKVYEQHPLITTDSRNCPEDSIFFALKGERFDGNQYAAEVLQKGCAMAVVDDAKVIPADDAERYFLVPDVLTALQQLAAYHRNQLRTWQQPVTVIGITGTNGKTTTKELTNAVLSRKYKVLATVGNLNNQIGVPLTLLKIRPGHELAIVEMGANHPMDIAELCDIARPDFGLITNVGKAHLLGFGSLEGVVAAKTKLYESLRLTGGTAFVDTENGYLTPHATGMNTIGYKAMPLVSCSPYLSFQLAFDGEAPLQVDTHLIGVYNLINASAAAAVGHHFGVPTADIQAAIAGYEPQNMRSQLVDLGHGRQLIMDAYNANPTSMMAALESFAHNEAPHKSLLLGEMRELGNESQREHERILTYLAECPVKYDDVLLVGDEFIKAFKALADEQVSAIGAKGSVRCYQNSDALCADEAVLANLGGTVLVKGSRGIQLEKVAQKLQSRV